MATYRPSFIDVSGLTQGIAQGLEIAAQRKRQEDALAEARVDDFMKMYQPGKLMQNNIPEFTNAYNNYKQAALQFSKLNRSGAKPEQIAASKANMDNALTGLNSVYSTSVKTAEKLAETADVLKIARSKGLSIPAELNQTYGMLSSAPVSQLINTIDKVPSPYSYKLLSEDVDYTKVFKDLDLIGAKATKSTQFVENPKSQYTFMGTPLKSRTKVTIESINPLAVAKALPTLLADPTHNGLKIQMDNKYNRFINSDPETKAQILNNLGPIFNVKSVEDIRPEMIMSYDLASSRISNEEDDPKFVQMQIDEIKLKSQKEENAKDRAVRAAKGDKGPEEWHPSVKIKGIVEQTTPSTKATDVSNDFKGYEMKDASGYSVPVDEVQYVGGDGKSIKPYFKVRLKGDTEFDILQPDAFSSRIVTAMGDINFQKGAVPLSDIQYGGTTQKPKKGGKTYVGVDANGNPIYK